MNENAVTTWGGRPLHGPAYTAPRDWDRSRWITPTRRGVTIHHEDGTVEHRYLDDEEG